MTWVHPPLRERELHSDSGMNFKMKEGMRERLDKKKGIWARERDSRRNLPRWLDKTGISSPLRVSPDISPLYNTVWPIQILMQQQYLQDSLSGEVSKFRDEPRNDRAWARSPNIFSPREAFQKKSKIEKSKNRNIKKSRNRKLKHLHLRVNYGDS